jgi:uncharacterized protein
MVQDSKQEAETRQNSLVDLLAGVNGGAINQTMAPASTPFTLAANNAYTPLSLNRVTLSYSYMTQGLVQNMVSTAVDDAFKGGIEIITSELDEEEKAELKREINRNRLRDKPTTRTRKNRSMRLSASGYGKSDVNVVKDVRTWARLFGGAGLIINSDQDFRAPFDPEKISRDTPLEFIAADRWELILATTNIWDETQERPFSYYGLPLHRSRVIPSMGLEAPSYVRVRLQGWGMSVLESAIRQINSFVKYESVIFELIDETKVDVYKINGFNASLLTSDGTNATKARIQLANQLKSYQNAIVMDSEDNYDKKQITFAGLADIWNELRRNLANALKIPMNKLFGESATGFGSGADAMENYHSIVEGERCASEPLLREVIDLRCMQLFGFIPDYDIKWPALKVLDGEAEQMVSTAIQNRVMQQFQARLITAKEASVIMREEGILKMDTEVLRGERDVDPLETAGAGMIGNENKLEKREDKPRNDKKAGGGKMKDS